MKERGNEPAVRPQRKLFAQRARLLVWTMLPATIGAGSAASASEAPALPASSAMEVEQQFAGPVSNTAIYRWRDPTNGSVCYVYVPVDAQYASSRASGFVKRAANTIGSISCIPPIAATGQ